MPAEKGKFVGQDHWNHGRSFGPKAHRLKKYEATWFAALMDGEGSIINSKKSTGGFCPRLWIGMTSLEMLSRVVEVTGVGTINLHSKPRKPNHAQAYTWRCDGANAISLLNQILPYLIIKQEKAIQMISDYDLR
jgi:hypothetical protein